MIRVTTASRIADLAYRVLTNAEQGLGDGLSENARLELERLIEPFGWDDLSPDSLGEYVQDLDDWLHRHGKEFPGA